MNSFTYWWQHLPLHIDPVLIQIGPVAIRYYGLMFLLSILVAYLVSRRRLSSEQHPYTLSQIEDYYTWSILGAIIGGRLGYVFFYNLDYYWGHPVEIFLPFDVENNFRLTGISGMSFHGGLLGVFCVTLWSAKKFKVSFWRWIDFLIVGVPAGYAFGRLGNFLNGELWGRATNVPWGMYFSDDTFNILRHPSQLYESFFEGIILFSILWMLRTKKRFEGALFSIYLIGYGGVRFFIEFTREPDAHIGFLFNLFTMGQILCGIMIALGFILYFILSKKKI